MKVDHSVIVTLWVVTSIFWMVLIDAVSYQNRTKRILLPMPQPWMAKKNRNKKSESYKMEISTSKESSTTIIPYSRQQMQHLEKSVLKLSNSFYWILIFNLTMYAKLLNSISCLVELLLLLT